MSFKYSLYFRVLHHEFPVRYLVAKKLHLSLGKRALLHFEVEFIVA